MTEAKDYAYFYFGPNDPPTAKKAEEKVTTTEPPKNCSPIFYVFVYGTLLRGEGNHHLLQSSYYVGQGFTEDLFVMFDVGFPLCRPPNEGENTWLMGPVKGEVYGVNELVLKRLDQLEGHPNFYTRRITAIAGYPKHVIYMYQWARQDGVVDDGYVAPNMLDVGAALDWKNRHKTRKAS